MWQLIAVVLFLMIIGSLLQWLGSLLYVLFLYVVLPFASLAAVFFGLDHRSGHRFYQSQAVRKADPTATALLVGSAVRTVRWWPEA